MIANEVLLVIEVLDLCLEFVSERFLVDRNDVVILVISLLGDFKYLVFVRPCFVNGDVPVQDSDGFEDVIGCFFAGVMWETLVSGNVIHKVGAHDRRWKEDGTRTVVVVQDNICGPVPPLFIR